LLLLDAVKECLKSGKKIVIFKSQKKTIFECNQMVKKLLELFLTKIKQRNNSDIYEKKNEPNPID